MLAQVMRVDDAPLRFEVHGVEEVVADRFRAPGLQSLGKGCAFINTDADPDDHEIPGRCRLADGLKRFLERILSFTRRAQE